MDKRIIGRHIIVYTGNAVSFSLPSSQKNCPAQKEINIDPMETKSNVRPSRSFLGTWLPKSFCWYWEVSMVRNKNKAMIEKNRATSEAIANNVNAGCSTRIGMPLRSLIPPGTVVAAGKTTVAMSVATTEQEFEVLFSHSPPSLKRSMWVSLKSSSGVLPLSLS
ncbi:hypothetical protein ACB098_10G177200 [Castanea mollissima]